jgi:hypothetical protein
MQALKRRSAKQQPQAAASSSVATAEEVGVPNEAAAYLASLQDLTVVERVRCTLHDAHVFKLPSIRPTATGGWRVSSIGAWKLINVLCGLIRAVSLHLAAT